MRVAAIDVGTNTTRLLIAESISQGHYRELDRRLIFTRLGEGVDSEGSIAREPMKRTLRAVAEFCAECGELGVSKIRLAATSAVRDAGNREDFLGEAARLTGGSAEILDGDSEALLSFRGAILDLPSGIYLVADIGGGSTEFLLGPTDGMLPSVEDSVSFNIGSVRLTERYLDSDPPKSEEMEAMQLQIDEALDDLSIRIPRAREAELVGVAGTATSLAAIALGLRKYEPDKTHLSRMRRERVAAILQKLARLPSEKRRRFPSLPEGRADVIVAGAAILLRTMTRFGFEEVIVSEKDILDGLILDMLDRIRAGHG